MRRIAVIVLAGVLLNCSGDNGGSNPMTPAPKTVVVEILDNSYNPQSVRINRGDTVRWVLSGAVPTHTVSALGGRFDSGFAFLQPGDTFEQTFNDRNTTFEYSCQTHKACCAMQGSVQVGDQAPTPMPGY